MDSSRSGLFSTLLMTLPLIIVPAMALLRPPTSASSLSSQNLSADDSADASESGLSADETGFPDDFSGKPAGEPISQSFEDADVSVIFGDAAKKRPAAAKATPEDAPGGLDDNTVPMVGSDPFQKGGGAPPAVVRGGISSAAPAPAPDPDNSSAQRIVQQLNALGSLRTLWFDAGDRTPVGFAAFFRGQTELTVYRFEAVGQTRAECARDVLDQVTAWRRQTATSP